MRSLATRYFGAGLICAGLALAPGCSRGIDSCHATGADCCQHSASGPCDHDADEHDHSATALDHDRHDCNVAECHTDIGPSGGRLIVLGDHEYHAELTIDHSAGAATVLILDHTGRRPMAIEQSHVILNLLIESRPRQVRLVASPLPTDPVPAASRFTGNDLVFSEGESISGRLSLMIGGKPYTGQLARREVGTQFIR